MKPTLHMSLTGQSGNLRTSICLHLVGRIEPIASCAELFMVCADLEGLFRFLCSMGAQGNVPCPLCSNVVSIKCGWALAGNALRAIDHLDKSDILFHTDEAFSGFCMICEQLLATIAMGEWVRGPMKKWSKSLDSNMWRTMFC